MAGLRGLAPGAWCGDLRGRVGPGFTSAEGQDLGPRGVGDTMHEHDLPQACPGEYIEDPAGHCPDRRRGNAAAARCHRGPVADLGGLAVADPAGLLAVLQPGIPCQDAAAGIVSRQDGEAQPVTVTPSPVLAREPPGRVALDGRPGPALRPARQRGRDLGG